jgi:uncharacterized protein (DUF302 family)
MNNVSSVQTVHVRLELPVAYDAFTRRLEGALGRFDPSVQSLFTKDPAAAEKRVHAMAGAQDLMVFWTFDHGLLLAMIGRPRKAKRYLLGNPLIALQMMQHDIRAGLYAPLTILVHELNAGTVCVEYDRPSSLFGQFGNRAVLEVSQSLDEKLAQVIETVARGAAT